LESPQVLRRFVFLKIYVFASSRKVFSEPVSAIIAPGEEGYFGVLPGHTPLRRMPFSEPARPKRADGLSGICGGQIDQLPTASEAHRLDFSKNFLSEKSSGRS